MAFTRHKPSLTLLLVTNFLISGVILTNPLRTSTLNVRYSVSEFIIFQCQSAIKIIGRLREEQYHRLGNDEVSPTIMTSRHTYFHPTETRYLTCREAAAIQSFPNKYKFEGTVSQQWRQIGNAVPPLLGKAVGLQILKMLREKKKATTLESKVIRQNAFDYEKDLTGELVPITKFV